MNLAAILAILPAFFKFFDQIQWFVKTLEKTPEEKRQELFAAIRKEADDYEASGRPNWK